MKIVNLIDHDIYTEKVAGWIYKEFVEGKNSNKSLEDVISNLKKRKKDDIPMTLIALEAGECLGTITIFENDLKAVDFSPWLGALYVDENHRGKGIAKVLIDKVMDVTKALGYSTLYLRTENTRGYYIESGWEFVLKTMDHEIGLETEVFKKEL